MATTTLPQSQQSTQDVLVPLFHVVLLNDDDHSYDYVVEMLQRLFLLSEAQAYQHAVEVDTVGRTIVLTAELPVASFAREQIQSYGADWRLPESKGSMTAILEPATGYSGSGGGHAA
ncbi:MAG: ATP-dependent Clp protease adaptor ClpS [Bryobacteraceae bacterium]|nr:ATP-dependent Clp protease adaptor ClpS [Bryobacteraceae bacterium]MDW8378406.1 ATP-dependent Clp protease adaptor ClpS [Bryobacterales bacterium]